MKKIILICFLIASILEANGQDNLLNEINNFPKEKIYLHTNTNFFLTGEQILYKLYCLDAKENGFSKLSKIGYVEVINENNESIFKQKINLINSEGNGEIFLDSSIKTGTYKLISYTQWMRNSQSFFEETIYIVNPFSAKLKIADYINKNNFEPINISNTSILTLKLNKKLFSKREKVIVHFKNTNESKTSVSTRRVDEIKILKEKNTISFLNDVKSSNFKSKKTYLPELRGELYHGNITSEKNKNISNQKIGISYVGKNKITKISTTDEKGSFYFNINKPSDSDNIIVEVLNVPKEDYKIQIDLNNALEKKFANFEELFLTEGLRELIKKKSEYLQIENAYNSVKQSTLKTPENNKYVFNNNQNNVIYVLDNYTRFKTVKEVVVEILQDVWLTKNKNDYSFHLRDINLESNNELETLLMVDGYLVHNHNDFVFYDALKIKSIEIIKEKYVFGSKIYQGIINIETLTNNFKPLVNSQNIFSLLKPLREKKYYHPDYSKNTNLRTPDFRTQLYWNPNLNSSTKEFSFYTSDVTGTYKILIEGFTKYGKPIHEELIFEVK